MMDRREFLIYVGGTLVAVPMVLEGISCSKNATPVSPQTGFTVRSTVTGVHSHEVTVFCADLSTASPSGVTYTSTTSEGHTHTLTLTQAQLMQIASGATVGPVTSS